jgi:hypothetical protein
MPSGRERQSTSGRHAPAAIHRDNLRRPIRPRVNFSMKDFCPLLDVPRAFDLHGQDAASVRSHAEGN